MPVNMNTHQYLQERLSTNGAVPPLPQFTHGVLFN